MCTVHKLKKKCRVSRWSIEISSFVSVLRLLVPPQVYFPLEAFPAEVTAERFEARVFPAVCDEVRALTEGLPAHLALVRLLPCGRKRDHRMSARSHFYARWRVGLFFCLFVFCTLCLTCVDERVFLHVWLLVEPLPAVLARVGPRVRVDEQVRGQRGGALEAFAADFTAEAPLL